MDKYRSKFDRRTTVEWITQAEEFERMAEQFKSNTELSGSFSELAADAREKALRASIRPLAPTRTGNMS